MVSTLPLDLLGELGSQRWLMPVLAQFAYKPGWRFVELSHASGAPRESLVRTLDLAGARGWVRANPGYGHPLRPEYVLAPEGMAIATAAAQVAERLDRLDVGPASLTRWSLPAVKALVLGNERFNQLVRALAPATPRALSQTLSALTANDLVAREVADSFPPSSRYRLTSRGLLLAG